MSPPDDAPHYATAAHAARLIGRSERTVQVWLKDAGHAPTPGVGYPVDALCAVVNSHTWPGQFTLRPAHFNVDAASAGAADRMPDAAHAALAVVSDLHRTLEALHADLDAMRAELAAVREGGEKAAQSAQDGQEGVLAALERIEQGQRRKGWWRRIFGG
jgi:hypothetical protein